MYATAREWTCCACGKVEVQPPPRGASLTPVPPLGWTMIDVTISVPAHSIKTAEGSVKVGDAIDTRRRTWCPSCSTIILGMFWKQEKGGTA